MAARGAERPARGALRPVPFRPEHLHALDFGGHERALLGGFDLPRCAAHWPDGPAASLLSADGRVLGCVGALRTDGGFTAWALLSDELRGRPVPLHRAARAGLARLAGEGVPIRATVAAGYSPGLRWLRALGFRPRRTLPAHGPNGETFVEYER